MSSSLQQGLILGRTGTRVVVEIDGEELPAIELARHLHGTGQAAAGDACLVGTMHGARTVIAVLGTAPAPVPPPPDDDPDDEGGAVVTPKPPPVAREGTTPVRPVWTGTYRGGWRTDTTELYQGDWTGRGINRGAAFFGQAFRVWDELLGVTVALRRKAGAGVSGAQAPTMTLLAGGARPAGAPVVLATATGPALRAGQPTGGRGNPPHWAVPSSWLPLLKSGEAGGIGCYVNSRSPYLALEVSGGAMTATAHWRDA